MSLLEDEKYMRLALEQASRAGRLGEVPVGAVLVAKDREIISTGHNLRESSSDPTDHAEIITIRLGAEKLRSWRLVDTTLYVTLEPCVMCMGAIVNSRIQTVVFGARDPKAGAVVSLYNIGRDKKLNHMVELREGILADECSSVLSEFFSNIRAD